MLFTLFLILHAADEEGETQSQQNTSNVSNEVVVHDIEKNCSGPHVHINSAGICECDTNYPYGDPNLPRGCWSCNPNCDINAKCVGQDICKCNDGYVGDGLDVCEVPRPKLLGYNPKYANVLGNEKITFEISTDGNNVSFTSAYCRFGSTVVEATVLNNSFVECSTIPTKIGSMPIGVAFDGMHWSVEEMEIKFLSSNTSPTVYLFVAVLVFLILSFVIIIMWFIRRQHQNALGEQNIILPLNKWHMSNPHINPTTEKNILDFFWNIIID